LDRGRQLALPYAEFGSLGAGPVAGGSGAVDLRDDPQRDPRLSAEAAGHGDDALQLEQAVDIDRLDGRREGGAELVLGFADAVQDDAVGREARKLGAEELAAGI